MVKKRSIEKIRPKKDKKIAEVKDIVKCPLLSKREKIKNIEKILKIKRYDAYKPKKIHEAFDGNFIQYQSKGDRDKSISIARYLRIIRGYLKKMIDSKKKKWRMEDSIKYEN